MRNIVCTPVIIYDSSNEKKNREFAIKNAKTVASWTKKIMVEKQQPDICFNNELYVPQVR